jgi:hypothetical protein
MGKEEGHTLWRKERRIKGKYACARCIIKSKYKVALRQVEYVLRVRPDTDEWSKDGSTNEARHEKDSN